MGPMKSQKQIWDFKERQLRILCEKIVYVEGTLTYIVSFLILKRPAKHYFLPTFRMQIVQSPF